MAPQGQRIISGARFLVQRSHKIILILCLRLRVIFRQGQRVQQRAAPKSSRRATEVKAMGRLLFQCEVRVILISGNLNVNVMGLRRIEARV